MEVRESVRAKLRDFDHLADVTHPLMGCLLYDRLNVHLSPV